jgi:hypothetical protein
MSKTRGPELRILDQNNKIFAVQDPVIFGYVTVKCGTFKYSKFSITE